jgi:hypothetical protein
MVELVFDCSSIAEGNRLRSELRDHARAIAAESKLCETAYRVLARVAVEEVDE